MREKSKAINTNEEGVRKKTQAFNRQKGHRAIRHAVHD